MEISILGLIWSQVSMEILRVFLRGKVFFWRMKTNSRFLCLKYLKIPNYTKNKYPSFNINVGWIYQFTP